MSDNHVIDRARSLQMELGLDGVLVTGPTNRRYLSAWTADDLAVDESSGVMLIGNGVASLFASGTNAPWAQAEARNVTVELWQRPWESFVVKRAKELGWQRVGYEDRALNVASFDAIRAAEPKLEWQPVGERIDDLRAVKSDAELGHLELAIKLTDDVFHALVAEIKPGDTERQVAWKIERLTRETTSGTVAFSPGIGGGPHSARPHHAAGDRPFQTGEPIVIDMGVAANGYCGDLTRTVWFGEPPERLRSVYNAVYRAQEAAIGAIAAGARAKDIDQIARDEIERAGYKDYIVHSLGHGLGLRVHEAPSLSIASEEILRSGHVVTVEPGVYIPDWGGVRIEDVVAVTDNGCKVLTAAAKHGGWQA